MKRLLILIFLVFSLGLTTSCSKWYESGYDDGYEDGYYDGYYALIVQKAMSHGNAIGAYLEADVFSFVKMGEDDETWAVYFYKKGSFTTYYAIKYTDYIPGWSNQNSSNWYSTFGPSNQNYYRQLTSWGDGTFTCDQGTCAGYMTSTIPWNIQNMIFEETHGTQKDMEKAGALLEGLKVEHAATYLEENFGLSEDRSWDVAKLVVNWEKVSKNRSMTNRDASVFANELLGADLPTWERAIKKSFSGESADYDELIKRAAQVNGITPEHVYEIINSFME
jgi:hypothetical protein